VSFAYITFRGLHYYTKLELDSDGCVDGGIVIVKCLYVPNNVLQLSQQKMAFGRFNGVSNDATVVHTAVLACPLRFSLHECGLPRRGK
jgi:hypothetical protein